jgi:hypothetical protein
MEYWSNGRAEDFPILQYSITPTLQLLNLSDRVRRYIAREQTGVHEIL